MTVFRGVSYRGNSVEDRLTIEHNYRVISELETNPIFRTRKITTLREKTYMSTPPKTRPIDWLMSTAQNLDSFLARTPSDAETKEI
jgi:hypothetical protein